MLASKICMIVDSYSLFSRGLSGSLSLNLSGNQKNLGQFLNRVTIRAHTATRQFIPEFL